MLDLISDGDRPVVDVTGIRLDIGCGFSKQDGWIRMDRRGRVEPDILQDVEEFPWPLRDNSVKIALASHLIEHLNPKVLIDFFEEVWRILEPDGTFLWAVPYAGSFGAYQDPTHVRPGFNEGTPHYFSPAHQLWQVYRPKPFDILDIKFNQTTNMEVTMKALKDGSKDVTEDMMIAWGIK